MTPVTTLAVGTGSVSAIEMVDAIPVDGNVKSYLQIGVAVLTLISMFRKEIKGLRETMKERKRKRRERKAEKEEESKDENKTI